MNTTRTESGSAKLGSFEFELQLPKNLRRPNQGPEALHHRCSRHLLLKREMIVVLAVAEWGQRRTPRVRDETLALRLRL